MTIVGKDLAQIYQVNDNDIGQRLDNFLLRNLKGVPNSRIYRMIRSGEVRINKKRADANTKLQLNDLIRIPPIRTAEKNLSGRLFGSMESLKHNFQIVFEDDYLLVIDKPSGIAVHGGSGISLGVIEQLRQMRPDARYLELIHRLDKDTSGLLMIAKKRSALVKIHEQLRQNHPQKFYLALCSPNWRDEVKHVKLPLIKYTGAAGEKMVRVNQQNGQYAHTIFRIQENFANATLMEAELKTGRTHQIRVHMQSQNCPILGDERYGNYTNNRLWAKQYGLKRMFLHATRLIINHPITNEKLTLIAKLPDDLQQLINILRNENNL
ncbi:MAG: RluA family pseudouridine synthase [Neisseriaceae bacterium]|nr:RluA family pseudouridine synthase [Neisseriaceae bacterium]